MSGPVLTKSTIRSRLSPENRLRLAIAAALSTALVAGPLAAADCPDPASAQTAQASPSAPPSEDQPQQDPPVDQDIHFDADGFEGERDGKMLLKGDVVITQGDRHIKTRDAIYDSAAQSFQVDHGVEYSDPDLKVSGAGAHLDQNGAATFEGAQFELPARNARGSADRINATTAGQLSLDNVRYTTCPVGNEDWILRASDIDINQRAGIGIGRGVRLDFKGVPILYTPFISFPVGAERKSGFLFPTIGTSSRNGYSLSVPWYWNIAPNYDATFTPTWFSKRGAKLDTELRYLSSLGRGSLQAEYLPDDKEAGDRRALVHFIDRSDFTDRLRLDIDAANVSDSQWFEDFGLGPEGTSTTYLNRAANLTYLSDRWFATLRAQNFQTIDDIGIAREDRPHTLLPQLAVRADFPDQPYGLALGFDFELANFAHNFDIVDTGWRMDVAPEVRMPLRGAGIYLEPSASFRYTAYRLDEARPGLDRSPQRSAPILSVDGGMIFERPAGSRQQRLHTIEPRFMYLYVPYRNQDDLPVFDTAAADLNLVQLFRTNRYVGADRLSDANQLAIGFTSRLLDARTGEEFISGTVGQAYYFHRPQIALPGEALEDPDSSDIIAELDVRAYGNWNVGMGVQWDPGDNRSEKGDIELQYKPAYDRVVNLGYRFRRGNIEQVDGSVAWPISDNWSGYGRMVYSLKDKATLDQFAGFEYRSCCWRLRVVGRRHVSDRTGDRDTSILLQLELNGLSNVGVGADAFLERAIRGYSVAPPAR
jgi:LPS-assembly protein